MGWSFKIATLFGIPIRVHVTFLIPLLMAAKEPGGRSAVILLLLVFVCVVLHELGHSLLARWYGIEVESITLLPIGGMAAMKTPPNSPRAEFWVAVAGPAVSVTLAGLLIVAAPYVHGPNVWNMFLRNHYNPPLLADLAIINVSLTLFNLVPAFPMDGGRVLRALLWWRTGFLRGTVIAARIGQVLAVGCFLFALFYSNVFLVLIALFIYFGAQSEGRAAGWINQFSNVPVVRAMQPEPVTLTPQSTIDQAALLMARTGQDHFPVTEGAEPAGILMRSALLKAIRDGQSDQPVERFIHREIIYCQPDDNLAGVIHQMDRRNLTCVLVMQQDKILGLITPEHLYRVMRGVGKA